ncbi:hypothetical protein GCM10023116_23810 [Kistimonas scapharcae]|uniref:Glycosyltransferase n=1 Tax=Kistimonas scapharcae TaxID=1036133 RepID=A0ABP8V1J7_9GAMM
MKVVHISKTPLAGSPSRISDALNNYTEFESCHFIESDYPGSLNGKMSAHSILIDEGGKRDWLLKEALKNAEIVHVHNDISGSVANCFSLCRDDCKFIYHVHSPLREGPLFSNVSEDIGVDFDLKMVVAQYHPRHYQGYVPVLNIVPFKSSVKVIENNEIPRVLFSPAHRRTGGRWNDKVSDGLQIALESLARFNKIELLEVDGLKPYELFSLRKYCHITIDEIVTGSYHQISLEGLAAGNVVISNSDFFSDMFLKMLTGCTYSPFLKANSSSIYDVLMGLVSDPVKIRNKQVESLEFYNKYLSPSVIIKKYVEAYNGLLNA